MKNEWLLLNKTIAVMNEGKKKERKRPRFIEYLREDGILTKSYDEWEQHKDEHLFSEGKYTGPFRETLND